MPVYTYQHIDAKGADCTESFEYVHGMSERLDKCPTCGHAVKKVVSAFAAGRNVLSPSNLKEKGFTKLVRRDKGVYEKE